MALNRLAGKLYLIPNVLGEGGGHTLPAENTTIVNTIQHFAVENEKSARRFLKRTGYKRPLDEARLLLLNKHADEEAVMNCLQVLLEGHSMGIISEAGCPGIADPGAQLVEVAHQNRIQVIPLVGPSSILLALMASGMSGQRFSFHGYLPYRGPERDKYLREMEMQSGRNGETQIFMETPYRNRQLLEDVLKVCRPQTQLCIACDLTLPSEYIRTQAVGDWKRGLPDVHKRPAIFLLYSESGTGRADKR